MGLKKLLSIGLALPVAVTWALASGVAVHAASSTRYVATTGTDNATCDSSNPCRTVQNAVNIAAPGDTIRIAAGTYTEQVTVPKSLNFIGAGIDQSVIKGPDVKSLDGFGQTFIFELNGAIVDNVTRLTVSGPGGPQGGNMCQPSNPISLDMGVVVAHGATLNMTNAAVREIRDVPDSGCQRGTAISIGRPGGFFACLGTDCVGHATITWVQVTHYQKNGVAARGAGSTMDVSNNAITNTPSPIIASNGVEVLTGARGDVQDNLITGNECNEVPPCGPNPLTDDQGSGVLSFQADLQTTIDHNVVGSNDTGIYTDDGIAVTNNNADGNRYEGIFVDKHAQGAVIQGNTANDGQYGIYVNAATGNTFQFDSAHRHSQVDMFTSNSANTFHSNSCDTAFPSTQVWDCAQPECQEGDGNGDFQGQQQGNFSSDNDGCKDGDQDGVHSTNRGDGKDFQSTQINSTKFDSVAHSITVTGLGISGGLPVSFVFVAIETGPTTPGWVSFTFSDGYTNAGPLLTGSVLLH
jgi:parallel beta helix pectate lyase-like protein/uncharacterized protein DUF1565